MIDSLHVIILVLLFIFISVSGYCLLSISLTVYKLAYGCRSTCERNEYFSLVEILPSGFSFFIIFGSIFYTGAFIFGWPLHLQTLFVQGFLLAGLLSAIYVAHVARKDSGGITCTSVWIIFCYLSVLFGVAASSYVLGRYPIFLSDDFGHLTIINRMMDSNSLDHYVLYMPDASTRHTFFPWHGMLASIGRMVGYGALETFAAAKIFLSATAVMSFMSFCATVLHGEKRLHFYVLYSAIIYAALSPETMIFHGVGDYHAISYILLFQAARIIWFVAMLRNANIAQYFAFTGLILAVSLIHVVDVATFLIMFFPYAFCLNVWTKDYDVLVKLCLLGLGTGVMAWVAKSAFYSTNLPLTYKIDITAFLKYYISRVDYEYGIPLILIALGTPLIARYLRLRSPALLWWPAGALLASLLLGSPNPLLTNMYAKIMSAELMERTMYGFPLALPMGIWLAWLTSQATTALRKRKLQYSMLIMLLILCAIGRQFWVRYGLNGEPSYAWPGTAHSLLAKQPNLFAYIKTLDRKVILTDMVTSAPITAVTSNYTYTNRPYVEINKDRIGEALLMMQSVGNKELTALFCKNHIDILLWNPNAPFDHKKHVGIIFDDYYRTNGQPLPEKNLALVATIDGASIYFFDRGLACG